MKKIVLCIMLFLIIPVNIIALQIDKNLNSGIILSADENIVPNDTVLSVNSINNTNVQSVAKNFGFTSYKTYNIDLLKEATRIIPNGEVTLSFPIPNNYNQSFPRQIFIIEINNNDLSQTVYATYNDDIGLYENLLIDNGNAILDTSNFRLDSDTTYILGTTANVITTTSKTVTNNPKTADGGFSNLQVISIVAVGGIMIMFTKLYLDSNK